MIGQIWQGGNVFRETCIMVEEDGKCSAKLLYRPEPHSVTVENYEGTETYEEHVDYELVGDVIELTPDSRIPMTGNDIFYLNTKEEADRELSELGNLGFGPVGTTDGRYITLRAVGHPEVLTQFMIAVSYRTEERASDAWLRTFSEPHGGLPNFKRKLMRQENVEILVYGDSISYGYDCSGIYGQEPNQPVWPELVRQELEERYEISVTMNNISMPSAGTEWAGPHAAERMKKEWNPDLVLLGYGMNDRCPADEYQRLTKELIAETKKCYPDAELVLIATTFPHELTHTPPIYFYSYQKEFPEKLYGLADEHTAVADVQAVQRFLMEKKRFIDLSANFLNHPNDFLARCQAEVVFDTITREAWKDAYQTIGTKLLKELLTGNPSENAVCSPFSLYLLLAMAANAAENTTESEFLTLLAPGYSKERLNEVMKRVQESFTAPTGNGKLVSSNGICVEKRFLPKIREEFKTLVSEAYGAEIFGSGSDMVGKINDWVKEKTDGMIPKLFDSAPANFLVCLLNAVAFDGKWMTEYEEYDINENGEFHNADGTVSKVPMLSSKETDYVEDAHFTGFIKDYRDGRYALLALLPKEDGKENDLSALAGGIDFSGLYRNRKDYTVYAEMPEFSCESGKELTEFCKRLGLTAMFTNRAEFTGMTACKGIKVDSVLQKAVISVNRAGTKAAAVTGMALCGCCLPDEDRERYVTLDRPFVFAVINKECDGLPVFAGAVNRI